MDGMNRTSRTITIKDIEPIIPFSRGTTEIFLTGHWSSRKPLYVEKTSPCRAGCPIGNDIARAFHQASLGHYDEALRIYRQENPFPGVCGRVCYHPCESECNRKEFDAAVNIRGFHGPAHKEGWGRGIGAGGLECCISFGAARLSGHGL